MKFLVTGSAGLVGRQIIRDLVQSHIQVYSCYHNSRPEAGAAIQLDLTNDYSIIKVIESTKPDVIIHLAAMTNVDLCENEKELALQINAKATKILSGQAAKNGSFFLYVSTDYVFDGKTGIKKESDQPNPIDYYGYSKYRGELAVQNMVSPWCIARTSTPFGNHNTKKSFPVFIAENLKSKKEITVVSDQFTSPTYVQNLSKMLLEITSRRITGIIHTAGATRISRFDMAQLVAERLNLDKDLIRPTTTEKMNWTAKRPKDSSLDVSKASRILREKPMKVDAALDLFISELK